MSCYIPIVPFFGESEDNELIKLIKFLRQIKKEKNYLPILKK